MAFKQQKILLKKQQQQHEKEKQEVREVKQGAPLMLLDTQQELNKIYCRYLTGEELISNRLTFRRLTCERS